MRVAIQSQAGVENRVVVGLGATGLSCVRFLHARGLAFSVIDTRANPPGLVQLQNSMPDVEVFVGDYPAEKLTNVQEVVVSPGIAMDDEIVVKARAAGARVIGDIDLFMREAAAPVIGITGSNAKSTVTELLGQMARTAGLNVGVGGNLGTPALELLAPERELYVLELSSFQLERAGTLGLTAATVLNVSADHLDRHGSMSNYQLAKHRIFHGCKKVVINRQDPLTIPLVPSDVSVVSWQLAAPEDGGFGLRASAEGEYLCHGDTNLLLVTEMSLRGRHNVANALAALALGYCAGLPKAAMVETLRTFLGLPHRCEVVAEIRGVRFVNDSKGTNVGATEAALQGLGGERDIVLIAGGQGKGADFSQLQSAVARHCKFLVLIGEDAALMERALGASVPVQRVASLHDAVTLAAARSVTGDTVLLSPACASFDMFTGYAQRGETFRKLVTALAEDAQ